MPTISYRQTSITTLMIKSFFIALLATASINFASYGYAIITEAPLPGFGLLGRWFTMLAHGQWTTTSISNMPAAPDEQVIGILGHFFISLLFSITYLLLCTHPLIKKIPTLINGTLFGLAVANFPIFVEYPSMGLSILHDTSPYLTPMFFRLIICHTFFGLGLGLGKIGLNYIEQPPH